MNNKLGYEKFKEDRLIRKHRVGKLAMGIVLVLTVSILSIPYLTNFKKEIVAGYQNIDEVEGEIGGYKVKLFNIHIDEMQFTFDVQVKDLPKNDKAGRELSYFFNIADEWVVNSKKVDEICTHSSSFNAEDITSIEIQGAGVKQLLMTEEIQVPFTLSSSEYDPKGENGQTLLGETILTLNIPKELQGETKQYALNKQITLEEGSIHFEELQVSPTMMKLNYTSEIVGGYITGLKNLKLVNKGKGYNECLSRSCIVDKKGGVEEYIVPSIYFNNAEKILLTADGYNYKKIDLEKFIISMEDELPREIICDGVTMTITNLIYQNNHLELVLHRQGDAYNIARFYINGVAHDQMGIHILNDDEHKVYEYRVNFPVSQADTYELSIEHNLEKQEPISCELDLKQ